MLIQDTVFSIYLPQNQIMLSPPAWMATYEKSKEVNKSDMREELKYELKGTTITYE